MWKRYPQYSELNFTVGALKMTSSQSVALDMETFQFEWKMLPPSVNFLYFLNVQYFKVYVK